MISFPMDIINYYDYARLVTEQCGTYYNKNRNWLKT